MDIGIDENDAQKVVKGLSVFLADSYGLYLKLQNFHWNITGEWFRDLHLLFEEQYGDINGAIDELAERITQLGGVAPGTFKEFTDLMSIDEAKGVPKAEGMLKELVKTHEQVIRSGRALISVAEEAGDVVTADLLTARLAFHEKAAWMLRSKLD